MNQITKTKTIWNRSRILFIIGTILVNICAVQVAQAQQTGVYLPFVTAGGTNPSNGGNPPNNTTVPIVTEDRSQIAIPNTASPTQSSSEVVIAGEGPVTTSGAEVLLQYTMVNWESGEVVETSEDFIPPFTMFIGDGIVPAYLENTVVGQNVDSRLLVILEKETADLPAEMDDSSAYALAVDIIDTYTPGQTVLAAALGDYRSVRSLVSTANAPSNGLELGGTIFNDINRNGIKDAGERGIRNVEILLYADTDGDDWPDGAHLAVANSGLSGNYLFTGLEAGDYVTRISPWYFRAGRPLDGSVACRDLDSATPLPPIDPDNDVDDDNNAVEYTSPTGRRSARTLGVTLSNGNEPTSEDGNADTNLTLDLCFMNTVIETPPLPNGEVDLSPEAVDDEYTRQVNTSLTENILENDTAGNGPLLVRFVSGELAPGLTLNPGGDLIGTVTEVGTYVFEYEISDYDGDSSTATVTVTVQADLMPDAIDDSASVDAGTPLTIDICLNDDFGDGFGSVTFVSGQIPPGLSLTGCILTGIPTTGGDFVFEYELMDTDGDVDIATVSIHVNLLPDAVDDSVLGAVNTPFNFDICTNDDFGDGFDSALFVSGGLAPGLELDGCILSGTPTLDGTYDFIYQLIDVDGDVDTATVTVEIPLIPVNLVPLAVGENASVEIIQTSSCDASEPVNVVFIIDDSGSIDTIERADILQSLQMLVDELQSFGNVQIGIVQYGQYDKQDATNTYVINSGYSSNLTVSLPNYPNLWADHLPISLRNMVNDGIFAPGGTLENPDGFFIFTDAWRSWSDSTDISTLFNEGLGYQPGADPQFEEYSNASNLYDTSVSIYHVNPSSYTPQNSQGIEQKNGLYLFRDSFVMSTADIEYLADNVYSNACVLETVSNNLTVDLCANDYMGDGFSSITKLSGTVPPGLTLNQCVLSGVATTEGTYSFEYELADIDGDTSTATATIDVLFNRSNQLPNAEEDSTTTKFVTHSFPRSVKAGTIASWFHDTQVEGPAAGTPTANQDGHVLAFPITDSGTQISWWNGGGSGADLSILAGAGVPETVGAGIGSLSYTQGGYSGAAFLTGISATSLSNAFISDTYLQYGFTTAADIDITYVHATSFTDLPADSGQWLADYQRAVLISDDGFASYTVLEQDQLATAGADYFPDTFPVEDTTVELKPATTYTVRVYVYGSTNGNNAVVDDFGIQVRSNSGDRDLTQRLELNICQNDDYGDGLSSITPLLTSLASGLELSGCYLSGKPAASGTYNFSYELRDIDGDADIADITIFVESEQRFSPIALDLFGAGSVDRITGKFDFDITGNGKQETLTEWFAPNAGILIDTSIPGNTSGQHLFGDMGGVYADGFEKLALLDANHDGEVAGAELSGLAIWTDVNSNARVDGGEVSALASHNIVALNTSHQNFVSSATLTDGSTLYMEDLWFTATVYP